MKIRKIKPTKTGIKIIGEGLFDTIEIDTPDLIEFQKYLLFNLQDLKEQYTRETGISLRRIDSGISKFEEKR